MTLASLGLKVKVIGQRSRSNAKNRVLTSLTLLLGQGQGKGQRSALKSWVKVEGQGQVSGA